MPPLDRTIWPCKELDHWRVLAMWIEEVVSSRAQGRTILYRGQPKACSLRPTLLRALPPATTATDAVAAERSALEHFKSQAHLHDPTFRLHFDGKIPSLLDWWALMQHHQAPTRLLDWTASPYVAAYFAAERDFRDDGVVLVIDGSAADEHFERVHPDAQMSEAWLLNPSNSPGVLTITTRTKTTRMVSQQGFFTVSSAVMEEHDALSSHGWRRDRSLDYSVEHQDRLVAASQGHERYRRNTLPWARWPRSFDCRDH